MTNNPTLLFWSGGKKSNLAFSFLKKNNPDQNIILITLLDKESNRVPYHGISEAIINSQSKLLNVQLIRIYLEKNLSPAEKLNLLEQRLHTFCHKKNFTLSFGDQQPHHFHLELAQKLNTKAIFPLSNSTSFELSEFYFQNNHQAIITGIDQNKLTDIYLGREYNREWLQTLPENIDYFGQSNEFHSFATYSPYFKMRVPYSKAIAVIEKNYLVSTIKEP